MQIQTTYVEHDLKKLYERAAQAMNLKSVSCLSFFIDTVGVGNQVMSFFVPENSTLSIIALTAVARVAGAGGANGITLSFTGGSGALTKNILPVAAILTQLYPTSGFNTTYEVPGNGFMNCSITADDHGAAPADISVFLTVRIV